MPDDAAVAELRATLRAHPEVVLDDLGVIRALVDALPSAGRQVTDLRDALVDRLEARLERLERTHRSVIAAAYENLAGTAQIQRVVVMLLEQDGFPAFLRVLLVEAPQILAVDTMRLVLESEEAAPGPVGDLEPGVGARVVTLPPGGIDAYLALGSTPPRDDVWLRPTPPEGEVLYGDETALAASEALVVLPLADGHKGLLAFGAEDARRFSPEHGTDLVEFLGAVVARVLRPYLTP
jgi:uncharacterized protein YigA (DUF484 family)